MLKAVLEIETTASSVDEAVTQSLIVLGCSRAEAETTILQTPSSGLFGLFFPRPARVRLCLTDRAFIARRLAEHLLKLCGIAARVEVLPGGREIRLRIHSEHAGLIIGRYGQTLDALQSLVGGLSDRVTVDRTAILLDIAGYRQQREDSPLPSTRRAGERDRHANRSAPRSDESSISLTSRTANPAAEIVACSPVFERHTLGASRPE